MTTLDFETDTTGNRCLRDKHFDRAAFPDLSLDTLPGTMLLLERVTFSRCKTDPGTCWIGGNTTLRDLVIDNLECGNALRIDSGCRFERVVLRRKRPTGKLIITPGDIASHRYNDDSGWCLDIKEFHGSEVVVVGIPSDRVRFDNHRHVVVHGSWRQTIDWKGLGVSSVGFFGITTKKVEAFGSETGIFSLPDPIKNAKYYEETLKELGILRGIGIAIG